MSWLGNGFREQAKSLADAYESMYAEETEKQREIRVKTQELLADTPAKKAKYKKDRELSKAKKEGPKDITPAKEQKTKKLSYDDKAEKKHAKDQGGGGGGRLKGGAAAGGAQGARPVKAKGGIHGKAYGAGAHVVDDKEANAKKYDDHAKKQREEAAKKRAQEKKDQKNESWLGMNGSSRSDFYALADAYKAMYMQQELSEEEIDEGALNNSHLNPNVQAKPSMDADSNLNKPFKKQKAPMTRKEEYDTLWDAYNMVYEKKKDSDKCGDDTYWDKEEKKCKAKKSSKSSGRTSISIIVGHGYPGYGGGGGGSDNDGDTDGGDGGDGGGGGGGE